MKIKLDKPYKALLWEELLVGGSIFSILVTVMVFVLVFGGYTPDPYDGNGPRFITYLGLKTEEIEYTSFILVGLLSLLLILNIGNTGEMLVGFPPRILRYPVDTSLPVAITLSCRLFLVLLLAFFSRVLMVGMFWEGGVRETFIGANSDYFANLEKYFLPFATSLFLHGSIFMFLQVMAWLFGFSILYFATVVLYIFLFIFLALVWNALWGIEGIPQNVPRIIKIGISMENLVYVLKNYPIPMLILVALLAFFLGIKIVKATRHRKRNVDTSFLYLILRVPYEKIVQSFSKPLSGFSSRFLAQLWYELKKTGLSIPLWTFIVWSFSLGTFYFLYNISYFMKIKYIFTPVTSFVLGNFGLVMFLILPYLSFWVGCGIWALTNTRKIFREMKTGRFDFYWYPILKMERFNVYWLALSINLLLGMLIVWIIQFGFVYLVYSNFWQPEFQESFYKIFPEYLWKLKAFSFLTLVNFITALTIINGLIVWVLLSNPRTVIFMILLPLFIFTVFMFAVGSFIWVDYAFSKATGYKGIGDWIGKKAEPLTEKVAEWEEFLGQKISSVVENVRNYLLENYTELYLKIEKIPYYLNLPLTKFPREDYFIYLFICFFFTGIYLLYYILVVYNRLVKPRDAFILILIFVATFLCFMPWGTMSYLNIGLTVGTYLLLASVINMFWVRTYLYVSGVRLLKRVKLSQEIGDVGEGNTTKHMLLAHLFAVGCVALIPILRVNPGTAKEISSEILRSRSLPTSLDEINRMYKSVTQKENLADQVIRVYKEFGEEFYVRDKGGEWFLCFCQDEMKLPSDECYELYKNFPPDIGGALIPNYTPLSEITWKTLEIYHKKLGKKYSDELKKIAESDYKGSRYPIDLRLGFEVPIPHVGGIRNLVRTLMLDALVNFVKEDYSEMVKAYRGALVLIDSIKDEPLVISQLVRNSLSETVLNTFIWCINHKEIPEPILRELCEVIVILRSSIEEFSQHHELVSSSELLSTFKMVRSSLYYWGSWISNIERHGVRVLIDPERFLVGVYETEIEKTWMPLIDIVGLRSFETASLLNLFSLVLNYQDKALKFGSVSIQEEKNLEKFFEVLSNEGSCVGILSPFTRLLGPSYMGKVSWSALRAKVSCDIALYLAEIDLFVRKQGKLPENLEELQSSYVREVPIDPFDNDFGKIKYKKFEDGSCVVYSVFIDRIDNGGKVMPKIYPYERAQDYGWVLLDLAKRQNLIISSEYIPSVLRFIREKKESQKKME
ncbi:MAG: hypothetical protein N3G21_11335 [Candidatus Hydrogenedentes bacterium]|nr:hypothetical protein [Candidatus Hydrogenedentota bacterium]